MAYAGDAKCTNREMRHGLCVAECGQGHKGDMKCSLRGVKKESLQTGWVRESFSGRVTLELGLGEQV